MQINAKTLGFKHGDRILLVFVSYLLFCYFVFSVADDTHLISKSKRKSWIDLNLNYLIELCMCMNEKFWNCKHVQCFLILHKRKRWRQCIGNRNNSSSPNVTHRRNKIIEHFYSVYVEIYAHMYFIYFFGFHFSISIFFSTYSLTLIVPIEIVEQKKKSL